MILPHITSIASDRHRGPWCEGKVHVGALDYTETQRRAAQLRQERGVPRDQCATPAVYRFDGRLLCARHAGDAAVQFITDPLGQKTRQRDVIDVRFP